MAPKSKKKKLSRIENKFEKLHNLALDDLLCSICQSILIEPVSLPCFHVFCQNCFFGSIENNALCCPLCRLRIGSWIRNATKQKNIIDQVLWDYIQTNYKNELDIKLKGEDLCLPEDYPKHRLSAPGEIRLEYESELDKLREERRREEEKHLKETQELIEKLRKEDEEYLQSLKQDEIFAAQLHLQNNNINIDQTPEEKGNSIEDLKQENIVKEGPVIKSEKKNNLITDYLIQNRPSNKSPVLTDDTSNDSPVMVTAGSSKTPGGGPTYGNYLKKFLHNKIRNVKDLWHKDKRCTPYVKAEPRNEVTKNATLKKATQSVPVSLPYKGLLLRTLAQNVKSKSPSGESDDSIQDEVLCFRHILSYGKTEQVNSVVVPTPSRMTRESTPPQPNDEPSREQYLQRLCELRHNSIKKKLPSAFVITLKSLQITKVSTRRSPRKLAGSISTSKLTEVVKNPKSRRGRAISTGSIPKTINVRTPKKENIKERQVVSERKSSLRSSTRKMQNGTSKSPSPAPNIIQLNRLNSVKKKLTDPMKEYDLKMIRNEQLAINQIIKQEKNDFDYAMRIDAELNGRRRVAGVKRQTTLNHYKLRAKKTKVTT